MTYTHNGVSVSLKRKAILTQATTWINLEDIILSGRNQSQKDKYCTVLLT